MKYKHRYNLFLPVIILLLVAVGCKKDVYLTDGGIHDANTTLSTYDYLSAHQYHYFDTLLMIVDHFNLKDSVNEAGTFFAPTDFSIHHLMEATATESLDALFTKISSKFITQYLFPEKDITLDDVTESVTTHKNWADTIAGVKKTANIYGSVNTTFTYYILQYVKINGYVDGTAGAPPDDPTDAILNCQTTGIKTSSGGTLHVLANNSSLSLK